MISEKGLITAMKQAYRLSGYEVCHYERNGKRFLISSGFWFADMPEKAVPNKVLSLVVEHTGAIPHFGAVKASRSGGAEEAMTDYVLSVIDRTVAVQLDAGAVKYIKTPMTFRGYEIYQAPENLKIMLADAAHTRIINQESAPAPLGYGNIMVWEADGELAAAAPLTIAPIPPVLSALENIQITER